MEAQDDSLRIAPNALGAFRHVCAFFNSIDEQHRVLHSFIKDGFDQGDKAFHLVDPERQEDHLTRLADAGIDVERPSTPVNSRCIRGKRARFAEIGSTRTRGLRRSSECSSPGPAAGYAQTRFLAQMEWALVDLPGVDDLIEFETRVNYVVPKYDDTVICAYDLSKFGASTVMYALRTHPVVIIALATSSRCWAPFSMSWWRSSIAIGRG